MKIKQRVIISIIVASIVLVAYLFSIKVQRTSDYMDVQLLIPLVAMFAAFFLSTFSIMTLLFNKESSKSSIIIVMIFSVLAFFQYKTGVITTKVMVAFMTMGLLSVIFNIITWFRGWLKKDSWL